MCLVQILYQRKWYLYRVPPEVLFASREINTSESKAEVREPLATKLAINMGPKFRFWLLSEIYKWLKTFQTILDCYPHFRVVYMVNL
jgi:hypothetical protein